RGSPGGAGAARPCVVVHHADLYRRRQRTAARSVSQRTPPRALSAYRRAGGADPAPLRSSAYSIHRSGKHRSEGDMSHVVHAVQHEAEHSIEHEQDHGGGHGKKTADNQNKKIALLIAVLALFLAISETLGKSSQTVGIELNIK